MTKEDIKNCLKEAQNENLLSYFVSDIKATMEFIIESTDVEFFIASEYFEEIAYMTQNKDFIECIRSRFIKIKDTSLDLKYICEMIQYAEEVFPQEEF